MYYDSPHKGDGNTYSGKLSGGWSYEGSMGDAGQSTIVINFQDGKKTTHSLKDSDLIHQNIRN